MRRFAAMGLMGAMALALAAGAWAQDIPWKTEAPAATPTAAPATTGTAAPAVTTTVAPAATPTGAPAVTSTATPVPAKTDIWGTGNSAATTVTSLAQDPKFARAVKPIEDQIAVVAKLQDLYDKEKTKPEKQQNVTLLTGYKTNIAQGFLRASGMAKMAESQFPKPEDKKQIADAYEIPLKAKSVAVDLELADEAIAKKDYRSAESLYKMVLQIDPKNQTALDGVKKIEELKRQPVAATGTGGSTTGGALRTDPQKPWETPKSWEQNPGYQKTWKTW